MDTIKAITSIFMVVLMATGLYFYTQKDTTIVLEGTTIPVNIDIPENLFNIQNNLGAPQVFIATPATSTDPGNFGFLIGTTTNLTAFGSTTLAIYGSTTIQTSVDTEHAFRIINSASTTIFQVNTLDGAVVVTGDLTISGTCSGCAGDPNVILTVSGGTTYLQASSTGNAWLFPDGFISAASSTFSFGTTTFASPMSIGTSTPHELAMLNIEVEASSIHGIKITGALNQEDDVHLISIESNAGTELFTVGNDGDVVIDHIASEAGEDALHIDNDINSVADVSALAISQTLTGLAAEETGTGISVTINTSDSASDSAYDALKCFSIGTGSAELTCLAVGTGLGVFHQNVGADLNPNSVLLASSTFSTFTDITAAATSASTDVEMFVSDNEYLVIRAGTQFEEIKFDLATESSKKIFQNTRTWEHSASGDTWIAFEPASTINGFEESGVVSMETDLIGGDWVVSTVNGVGSLFSIRVQRTRNNINTVPIENLIQVAATSTFFWDENAAVAVDILYASSTALIDGLSTLTGFISNASSTVIGDLTITSLGNSMVIGGDSTGAFIQTGTTGQTIPLRFFTPDGLERMRLVSTGEFGIGTTSPYAKLSVVGEVVMETFNATSTTASSTIAFGLTTDTLNVGSTATSTFGNGIRIAAGRLTIDDLSTCAVGIDGDGVLKCGIPSASTPTLSLSNNLSIDTSTSSLQYHDGTAVRRLLPNTDSSTIYATSTLVFDGEFSATGTTTYALANYRHTVTLLALFCKIDAGTVIVAIGTGIASSTVTCDTTGAESTTEVEFESRTDYFIAIGTLTGAASLITVTDTIRQDN